MTSSKYVILTASADTALSSIVEGRILDGWVPQGGVSVSKDGINTVFAQAMVKVGTTEPLEEAEEALLQ